MTNFPRTKDLLSDLDKEVAELKVTKRDLQKDMDQYLERESKMLNLQSELSRSNALLRSENSSLSNKVTFLVISLFPCFFINLTLFSSIYIFVSVL